MDTRADRPAGSVIDVTLSWPAPSVGRVRLSIEATLLAFWLCGWAVSWLLMAGQFANGGPHPAHPRVPPLLDFWFLVVWLSLWTMGGGVALERVEERQRLWLDRGTDRLEIGAGLRESDREWLFAVLQSWHAPNEALVRHEVTDITAVLQDSC